MWSEHGMNTNATYDHFANLWDRYNGLDRGYHGIDHIREGLAVFDDTMSLAANPFAVEIAWWCHDVIYIPGSRKNEVQSGRWADKMLRNVRAPQRLRADTYRCIIATMHNKVETERDCQLICDIDLSTFAAATWDEVLAHTLGIRKEFMHVPLDYFIEHRRRILAEFAAREHIYYLDHFRLKYGAKAKENIAREIDELPKMITE